MARKDRYSMIVCLVLACAVSASVRAGFIENGVPVCTTPDDQLELRMIPDGSGGAIIVWQDHRSGTFDIYVQRIDASGTVRWTAGGVPIRISTEDQVDPRIVPDGSGGAIVAWRDSYPGKYIDIYAQRVDADGAVLWTAGGIPVCTIGFAWNPELIPDDAGGAIITWQDYRPMGNGDVYAQRIDANGAVQWTMDGIPVSTAAGTQAYPEIVTDGGGGAIITWQDSRGADYDIYAQRIDADGNTLWTADGVPVCTAVEYQATPRLTSDARGGAIIVWADKRWSYECDIYAQRIDADGADVWVTNGVPVCSADDSQYEHHIVPDGAGGAIIVWHDERSGYYATADIYAQRIDTTGIVQLMADGVPVCTAVDAQHQPRLIPDDAGGAIIAWQDYRSGDYDIYIQRIDAGGIFQWIPYGVTLCSAVGNQGNLQIIPDNAGGAIVAWEDLRDTIFSNDIYAARIDAGGDPIATLLQEYGASCRDGAIRISWTLFEADEILSFRMLRAEGKAPYLKQLDTEQIVRDDLRFNFTDTGCAPGTTYRYRVDVMDEYGRRPLFETNPVTVPAMSPALCQNHPNPFNPATTITFYLPEASHTVLDVFDSAGRRVAILIDEYRDRGSHSINWEARSATGTSLSSGVYFYRLRVGKASITRKMLLLR